MTAELVEASRRIAAYWAARSRAWLADEYEAVTMAALGEAMVRHDPDRAPLHDYALYLMHRRCRDLCRVWVHDARRPYALRSRPFAWVPEQEAPPYDDTRWLLANLLRAVDDAHAGGLVSDKAREAVLLWLETESQKEVAARLGVTPSRVSQLVHEVIDAVREIGVAS